MIDQDDLHARLTKAFGAVPEAQRDIFRRLCAGDPDAVTDADLAAITPLMDRMSAELGRPPVRTSTPPVEMNLTGYLFPHKGSEGDATCPAFLGLGGSNALYLPCFSTIEKLRATMEGIGATYVGVKHIDDGLVFLSELPKELGGKPIKIMIDPYTTPDGAIRYVEVSLD